MTSQPFVDTDNPIVFCRRPWRLLGAVVVALMAVTVLWGVLVLGHYQDDDRYGSESQLSVTDFMMRTVALPGALSLADAVDRHLQNLFAAHGDGLPPDGMYDRIISEVERPLLSLALGATRGNQLRAARLLGLNRNTLRKKIKDLDVPVVRTPQVRRGG